MPAFEIFIIRRAKKAFNERKDYKYWHKVGLQNFIARNWDGAIKAFERVTTLKKNYYKAWNGLTRCYWQLGNYDKAIEALKKSQKITKKDRDIGIINLVELYELKGDNENAINIIKQLLIEKKPKNNEN